MTEEIGDRAVFQIQYVHEPFPGSEGYIFGRMCFRFGADVLGDFDEPACMLNVTARHVEDVLTSLGDSDDPELCALTDEQLWEQLDSALYRDDSRTIEQIVADATRYGRFNFLTNGGESFDHSTSFFVGCAHEVRVLFKSDDQPVIVRRIDRRAFVETLQAWLHQYMESST
jgi:hypothetical protein